MALTVQKLKKEVAAGEDSTRQFKSRINNVDALAAEMAAFANANGGVIFIGVQDDGTISGITSQEVHTVNQLISNAASQHVRSPLTVGTENILLENGNVVIVLNIPAGIDKPYFDKNGVIWLKAGSDKRRINSKEELRRLFQYSGQFHADELPTKASIDKIDDQLFKEFLREHYNTKFPGTKDKQLRLLQNPRRPDSSATPCGGGISRWLKHALHAPSCLRGFSFTRRSLRRSAALLLRGLVKLCALRPGELQRKLEPLYAKRKLMEGGSGGPLPRLRLILELATLILPLIMGISTLPGCFFLPNSRS